MNMIIISDSMRAAQEIVMAAQEVAKTAKTTNQVYNAMK